MIITKDNTNLTNKKQEIIKEEKTVKKIKFSIKRTSVNESLLKQLIRVETLLRCAFVQEDQGSLHIFQNSHFHPVRWG